MVKKPEAAPASHPSRETIDLLLNRGEAAEIDSLLQKANQDYLYWDRFKQLTMPQGVTPEVAWTVLKLTREISRRRTQITAVDGNRFWYSLTDELQRSLMVIDQQAGGWIGTTAPEISRNVKRTYLLSRLMEEAIASSQIEGAATTRREAKEMLRTGREPQTRSERMILNNYLTIGRMRELSDKPLSPALLLELQASLTAETLNNPSEVGRFRTDEDDDIVVGNQTGEVLHVPPRASTLRDQLDELCRYANEDGEQFVHPVLKASMLHFWLAYLHPFCDGNGRTARALFYLHALSHGYWLFEYVSISRVILRRKAQYARAFLYSEIDDADLTYFLTFHVHAIEKALQEFWEYVERKAQEDRELESSVSKDGGFNYRQRALLSRAMKDSGTRFTIESHRASHNVAYATARSDLLELADRGYFVQLREGRSFVFVPAGDLRIRLESR